MEDWNDYLLILALYRAKTLRGASLMLGTTHTTLARRLELLHKRRQGVVFEKYSSGYRPTPLGQQLITVAQRVEQVVITADRIDRAKGDTLAGPITLSLAEAMAQYLLLAPLAEFAKCYPEISLNIDCSTEVVNLDKSEADIAIRSVNILPDHLVGRRLFAYSLSYYSQHAYFSDTPPEKRRWIAPSTQEVWPEWLADSPFPEAPIGLTISDIVTRFKALEAGHGMSRAACFMADNHPDLIRLPGAKVLQQPDIWVLTPPDLRESPRIKLLMQFLVDALHSKKALLTGSE